MKIPAYKAMFTQYQPGNAAHIHLFQQAIKPDKDAPLSKNTEEYLRDAMHQASKSQNVISLFSGPDERTKLLQLQQAAFLTKSAVCVIDSQLLASQYIGETEKNLAHLVAQAQLSYGLLYFAKAEHLFAESTPPLPASTLSVNHSAQRIIERLSQYPAWVILDVDSTDKFLPLLPRVHSVITFN